MNFTKWVLAGCVWLLASAVSASPLDAARTLLGTGTLDSEATEQIFHQALGANTQGIPLAHLDVVVWDARTGKQLGDRELANILGVTPRTGAAELLQMVQQMMGLPIEQDRLMRLLDAAALASLRRPPDYLAVEFYDDRQGYQRDLTGGVAGKVSTPGAEAPTSHWQRQQPAAQTKKSIEEPDPWPKQPLDEMQVAASAEAAQLTRRQAKQFLRELGATTQQLNSLEVFVTSAQVDSEKEVEQRLIDSTQGFVQQMYRNEYRLVAVSTPLLVRQGSTSQVIANLILLFGTAKDYDQATALRHAIEGSGALDFNPDYYNRTYFN